MRTLRAWLIRLAGFFRRDRRERELAAEIDTHLRMHIEDNLRAGMNQEEARRNALTKLGGIEQTKELYRDRRSLPILETLLQDLRFGARMLRKNSGFTVVAVLTLALGIGASTAIFSVVYGVLLRPLPYSNPEQIVRLWESNATYTRMNFADPNFEDIRSQNHSLQGLAEYNTTLQSVTGGSQTTRTLSAAVSRDFFSVMRVQPVFGRGFAAEEHRFGAAPVALVSYGYWKQYLGGTTDLSAVRLKVENQSATVIGVLPPGFRFPDDADIWVPREFFERLPSRTAHNWQVVARLRDGVALNQAHAELAAIAAKLKQQYGQDINMTDVAIAKLQDAISNQVRPALLILLGAVGFLLLIACANVGNLLLAQAAMRERELAIRAALGAGRRRLVRQFLTEALLISLSGAALGVLVALWGVAGLVAMAPDNLPRLDSVSINFPVLVFTFCVALLVAIGLGIFSAMRATTGDVQRALGEHGRSQTSTLRNQRLGRVIIAGQLAVTLVLLVGAGLLGRSLLRLLSVDPGFHTEHVITMDLALSSPEQDADKVRRVAFLNELFARLGALPGVEEVGGTQSLPLTSSLADGTYVMMNPGEVLPRSMEDLDRLFHDSTRTGDADYCPASEGYFRVLGIPLLRGRLFDARDTMNAPHAALISDSLAHEKWPGQDPLGHEIEFGNMDGDLRFLTVVGVVGDVRTASLEAPPRPTIYVNYRQRPQATRDFSIVLRTAAEPASVLSAAREIVRNLDPDVPPSLGTFTKIFSESLKSRRFNLLLVGVFAGAALLLAIVGMYGVMAYSVAQRTGEIGVRMALGASPRSVLRLVLGQGLWATVAGIAIGILGSFALTRTMASLLFGLSPTDPLTFAGVAVLLAFVALLASYIPARRAMRVDPMVALRYE
jgi:putative ABC transport system permease protein